MRKPTFISLFAGMGGFDLAFERAGMECACHVEIDPQCRRLLKARFPNSKTHDDVTTFNPDDHECPDVITFGFPCQDVSVAGTRAGMKQGETRTGLFYEAARIIAGFVPRGLSIAVAENVPGLFSSNEGRDFAAVIGTMGELGALDIGWATLDAQWFGVAQRRERVFIVIDFRGKRAEQILSLLEGLCGDSPPSREKGKGTAASFTPSSHGGYKEGAGTLRANGGDLGGGSEQCSGDRCGSGAMGKWRRSDRKSNGANTSQQRRA